MMVPSCFQEPGSNGQREQCHSCFCNPVDSGSLGNEPMPAIGNNYHKDRVGHNSCTSVSFHGGYDISYKCVRKATEGGHRQ